MLEDVHEIAGESGLALHPDKTKILSSTTRRKGRDGRKTVDVHGLPIEVLSFNSDVKYLGRKITFDDNNATEFNNRIRSAWGKFTTHKQELTGRAYSLNDRLRLFDATVSPTVLYGCSSWALTAQQETTLQSTQRKMLRMILGEKRRQMAPSSDADTSGHDVASNPEEVHPDSAEEDDDNDNDDQLEDWVEWIRRVTHKVENQMSKLELESWIAKARRIKWRWAWRVLSEPSKDKWSPKVFTMAP